MIILPFTVAEPRVFGRQLQPAGDSRGAERFGTPQRAGRALEPADQGKRRHGRAEKAHAHPAEARHPLQPLESPGVCSPCRVTTQRKASREWQLFWCLGSPKWSEWPSWAA